MVITRRLPPCSMGFRNPLLTLSFLDLDRGTVSDALRVVSDPVVLPY